MKVADGSLGSRVWAVAGSAPANKNNTNENKGPTLRISVAFSVASRFMTRSTAT